MPRPLCLCAPLASGAGGPPHGFALPPARRRGVSFVAVIVSLLIVALATIAAASTMVALRATKERDRARADFQAASKAIDQYVIAIATNGDMKGTRMNELRSAMFQPALDYYQQFIQSHEGDQEALPELADAYLHVAGIQAKHGLQESVATLNKGIGLFNQMRELKVDPDRYPSAHHAAMQYTMPIEWVSLSKMNRSSGGAMVLGFESVALTLDNMIAEHPHAASFREDLAGVVRIPATLFGFVGVNNLAIRNWQRAVDALDPLVREQPDKVDYKLQLAEALAALASRQKSDGKIESSVANYKRVVQIREEIAAAEPEEAARKQQLKVAQNDLQRAEKALPVKKEDESAQEEGAAKGVDDSAKVAPADDASPGDAQESPATANQPPADAPAATP